MTWNPDAPIEMLERASRVVWELCGPAPYLNWLEQEVSRTKVYLNYKEAVVFMASTAGGARDPQQLSPEAATGAASPIVEELVDTLRWYADMTNYDFEGRTVAPVVGDEGNRARVALVKYEAGRPA